MLNLYLTIGNIGSGKTQWAKKFVSKNRDTKIVSADSFRQMLNGSYEYIAGLDNLIDALMIESVRILLACNYSVIVDCCNMTKERRAGWLSATSNCKKIAVIFETKDKNWHISNRAKEAHCKNKDWGKIFDDNEKAFEPASRDEEFDEIVRVNSW